MLGILELVTLSHVVTSEVLMSLRLRQCVAGTRRFESTYYRLLQ